ncbi:Turripeptide OL11-like [Orchesella cincta]|uniref:Turripeptide OL11-like n=1 Tax=Orchesella cincta TaxID=48709 RepID=A0A1D2M3S2_ORCCI|nr:Turripeptide OL11-like [Orchesella cincta]
MKYFSLIFVALLAVNFMATTAEPCICTFLYWPMCGSDGKTYPSACDLDCAAKTNPDLTVAKEGEC